MIYSIILYKNYNFYIFNLFYELKYIVLFNL
jgi:hypothetical protein